MKNPLLAYALTRIGIFILLTTALVLIGFNAFYATLIAAILSLAFSLVFLAKQRAAVNEYVASKIKKADTTGADDSDSDLENEILDRREGPSK